MQVYYRLFGLQNYVDMLQQMQDFTVNRDENTIDEIWCCQHYPVFTQGYAGKAEHILNPHNIPIIQSDRGGQVTYHGPGQLVIYTLIDLKRLGFKIRDLVCALESSVIDILSAHGIHAQAKREAPGVYVNDAKICSVGLRVKRSCSFHGLAFNIDMDLTPFSYINPCGFKNLPMTQLAELVPGISIEQVQTDLLKTLSQRLGYTAIKLNHEVAHVPA